jgi:hypothetical protein
MAFAKADDFRLIQGSDVLSDYQHTPSSKPAPFLHFSFCSRCGVRPFTRGGALPQFGGPFYAVNIGCLDDATDEELARAPIHFADGRNDNWDASPEHRYL